MTFSSESATLISRIRNDYVTITLPYYLHYLKMNEKRYGSGIQTDFKQFGNQLFMYQLLDMRDTVTHMFEYPDIVNDMIEDVTNSETLHLPYERTALWVQDDFVFLLQKILFNVPDEDTGEIIEENRLTLSCAGTAPESENNWMVWPFAGFIVEPDVGHWSLADWLLDIENDLLSKKNMAANVKEMIQEGLMALAVLLTMQYHKKLKLVPSEGVPTQRNTKRIKKGKLPYWDYHVAKFTDTVTEPGEPKGGTHAPPKCHWRCGHWRRLPHQTDQKIWIRPTMVGDPRNGFVRKTYKVDRPTDD